MGQSASTNSQAVAKNKGGAAPFATVNATAANVAAINAANAATSNAQNQQLHHQQALWAANQQVVPNSVRCGGSCSSTSAGPGAGVAADSAYYFHGSDCLQRAQERFQFEKDQSRYNRLHDAAACSTACAHKFQTACRRGCSQTDLMWDAGVTTADDRFARESAVLAKQLAAQQRTLHSNQRYGGFQTVATNGRNAPTAAPLTPLALAPVAPLGGNASIMAPPLGAVSVANASAAPLINQNAQDEEANDAIQGIVRPPINSLNLAQNAASRASNAGLLSSGAAARNTTNIGNALLASNQFALNGATADVNAAAFAANSLLASDAVAAANGIAAANAAAGLPFAHHLGGGGAGNLGAVNLGAAGALPYNGLGGAFGSAFGGSIF